MPDESVVIRPASPADVSDIARLSEPFAADGLLIVRSSAQFRHRIEDYLVTVRGSRVLGCVGLTRLGSDVLLYNLCVAAELQGQGIGSRMVAHADTLASHDGCRSLLAASRHAGRWFLRHGFTRIERHDVPPAWSALLPPGRLSQLYRRPVAPSAGPPAFTSTRQGAERS
ncbi:GNAT family N-acetyltransferase [Streptomyces parvulus]|uniref:GNAT family N-acetyltransferase n=1 Tax=Streptomyces parvulus TaxID=146923 RepID=UPI003456F7DD